MPVSAWIRNLFADSKTQEDQSLSKSETISIIDPEAVGDSPQAKIRPLTLSIIGKKMRDDGSHKEEAVVLAFWANNMKKVYEKSLEDFNKASEMFMNLSKKAEEIKEQIVAGSFEQAEEASKAFLTDLKLNEPTTPQISQEPAQIGPMGSVSVVDGIPRFAFDDAYLVSTLQPIDISPTAPISFNESKAVHVYATYARNHVGKDDYVLQWYPKVLTSEGMVANVALIEKNSNLYFVVPDCDEKRFLKLCRLLTPVYSDIGYEIKEGSLRPTAKVTVMHFDTPDDAAKYQKMVVPGAPPEEKPSPSMPAKLEEAGKELAKAPEPKTLSQVKTEEAGEKLEKATASLGVEAKKKKEDPDAPKYTMSGDPARNAQNDFRLSRWDDQAPSATPHSYYSVLKVRYNPELANYQLDFPQGTRVNVSRDNAKGYLLREGYPVDEANDHLDKAQKGEVVLRKAASLKTASARLLKFAIARDIEQGNLDPVGVAKKFSVPETLISSLAGELVSDGKNDAIQTVAKLLKDSPRRRKIFASMVETSHASKEINDEDLKNFKTALAAAELNGKAECWTKLAELSNALFEKAKNQ